MVIKSQNGKNLAKKNKIHTPEKRANKQQNSYFKLEVAEHISQEVYGIFYLTLALVFGLILINRSGPAGAFLSSILAKLFGVGMWMIPVLFLFLALTLFLSKEIKFTFTRNLGIFLLLSSILGLIHLSSPIALSGDNVEKYGGIIGFTISFLLRIFFSTETSDLIAGVILFGILIISLLLTLEISFHDIWRYFHPTTELKKVKADNEQLIITNKNDLSDGEIRIIKPLAIDAEYSDPNNDKKSSKDSIKEKLGLNKLTAGLNVKRPTKKDALEITNIQVSGDWKFPPLDLLISEFSDNYPEDHVLKKQAQNIKEKLNEFDIAVDMVDARVGPTVTQFTVSPQEGVPVKKIVASKNDLALALAAKSVRIEAPIPGQPYVGIEIPNESRSVVYMREILESEAFVKINSSLRLAMGKDVAGEPIVADLAKMPHLLIAGATGAGKSVGMNAFLISLLYQNSPADLKFIMIDPKRVELTGYNGIPHLLTPVITEADKALAALKWSVAEMMRRYQECSEKGYRNIEEYNEAEAQKMPKIIVVIDELADLMMRDFKKDTENAICRLAQMARAVGVHLIIATQRPSVDVITGVIKANIPTRISFTVTSVVDSRTILDAVGAEELLGMGDMLYINAQLPKPMRIQGIYISSKEIERVVNYIKLTPESGNVTSINLNGEDEEDSNNMAFANIDLDAIAEATNEDELVPEAIEIIRSSKKASATMLQRMLSVGYARAAKILDILENKGFIGPVNGAKPRDIYFEKFEK